MQWILCNMAWWICMLMACMCGLAVCMTWVSGGVMSEHGIQQSHLSAYCLASSQGWGQEAARGASQDNSLAYTAGLEHLLYTRPGISLLQAVLSCMPPPPALLLSVQGWNLCKYKFVEISGNNLEISQTWGFCLCFCLSTLTINVPVVYMVRYVVVLRYS